MLKFLPLDLRAKSPRDCWTSSSPTLKFQPGAAHASGTRPHAILEHIINHARESRRMRQTARTNDSPKFMAVLCPCPWDARWCLWLCHWIRGAKTLPSSPLSSFFIPRLITFRFHEPSNARDISLRLKGARHCNLLRTWLSTWGENFATSVKSSRGD